MSLTLVSSAFPDGGKIPRKFSRLGENLFPPLTWTGAPDGVQSYALIVEDPDAPSGTFRHCGIFNIPAEVNELRESADTAPGGGPRFSENDFGNARYDGPQPPRGHGVHHYHFRLAALDVPNLSVPSSAGIAAMWREARKHILEQADLTGTFEVP
ncbi:YbhB/YbcL family Raf kinase inhibitor-like protein [Rhizobium giardinii]|jgi:Raf kinase inhibitor-like YbhB/YbcL family protein|uniref:YbhB/YbcL family Raf kinase inhibitor-like protein n=1 Tax=Rhizobium giardinii TaxID=56731 RepID=UPI003D6E5DEC